MFPSFQDVGRRPVNHLDLPLLPLFLGILPTATNPVAYLLDAVARLYHKLPNHLRVVPERRILLSCRSGADVYIMDYVLGGWLCRKEGISHLYALQGRGSSCGDRAVGTELTDRFPKVNWTWGRGDACNASSVSADILRKIACFGFELKASSGREWPCKEIVVFSGRGMPRQQCRRWWVSVGKGGCTSTVVTK